MDTMENSEPNKSNEIKLQDLMKLEEFMSENNYLPPFMQDLHDIKNIFKAIEDSIITNRRKSDNPLFSNSEGNITWCQGLIYTTEIFLYFMAHHGYTLQKSKRNLPFYELEDTINEWKKINEEKYLSSINEQINS